jgi:Cytosol aminopeptidase family, N-terminal domain.
MTVSTTTDAPVELEVDLLVLPFTMATPAPLVETLSDTLGAAAADVALDHEAETVGCLLPVEERLEDVRTAQGLVEGFVLGAYRYRRYETADGFDGPSAFYMHVGDDYDRASVDDGATRGRHLAAAAGMARDLVNPG